MVRLLRQTSVYSVMSKSLCIIGGTVADASVGVRVLWERCIICQQEFPNKPLVRPSESKKRLDGDGYVTLEKDLLGFHDIACLPRNINIALLDTGSGIANTLRENNACWHKSCRDSLNATKISRARKRKVECSEAAAAQDSGDSDAEGDVLPSNSSLSTRQSGVKPGTDGSGSVCFFCEATQSDDKLWQVTTFSVDERVRQCAILLQDFKVLGKLSKGDLIATEAHYHARCLVAYYNSAKRLKVTDKDTVSDTDMNVQGIVLAELIAYIEDIRSNQSIAPVFKLTELKKLYTSKLAAYGIASESYVHSTRLKQRILGYFPDMLAVCEGRGHETLLMFDQNLAQTLHKACQYDADADGMHLVRAAQIVRRELFAKEHLFTGRFSPDCEVESVSKSLLTLVQFILEGPCIDDANEHCSRAALSLAELITFNSVKKSRSSIAESIPSESTLPSVRHNRCMETPLPIYMSLVLHSVTRKRQLVDKFHHLGLSISYDRLLKITTDVANEVSANYAHENIVCPASMKHGLFTLAAFDNIDHNPSSNTAQHSFHGTSMTLMQNQFADRSGSATESDTTSSAGGFWHCSSSSRTISPLPLSYTHVKPSTTAHLLSNIPAFPNLTSSMNSELPLHSVLLFSPWMQLVLDSTQTDNWAENLTWAAYHASQPEAQMCENTKPAQIALLPLFADSAHSIAMIKHGMDCISKAVNKLNTDQTPVIAFDQPLYAMAKMIQWSEHERYGEAKLVLLLGGLHIEMAAWRTVGDWIAGSGWTEALDRANVASFGTADSFLKACHVKRTRQAHIVTVAALHILRRRAYDAYCSSVIASENILSFEDWCGERTNESPQFAYWTSVLEFELTVLAVVYAIRMRNFSLYCKALLELVPWFFALDHTNYARWLPVHIRDMVSLRERHPPVAAEFDKGGFVVCKSVHSFSAIAVDHAHEQANKSIKDEGGAIGLTGNDHALRRWMIAGPEVTRMIEEFETVSYTSDSRHHEQTKSFHSRFKKDVTKLVDIFEQFDNPFAADHTDLISVVSNVVADEQVSVTVKTAYTLGQKQFEEFVEQRLCESRVPVNAVIKRNKLALFSNSHTQRVSKGKLRLTAAKNDSALFSRLYIASQCRDGDLDNFFRHENQPYPPALALGAEMRHGNKSDLLTCLPTGSSAVVTQPPVDCVILDGAAVVQMCKPASGMTFSDYADSVFSRHIHPYFQQSVRVDVVFDVYRKMSLKQQTRLRRGDGVRHYVTTESKIPPKWQLFLRVDENKTQLFSLLARSFASRQIAGKLIIATVEENVVSSGDVPLSLQSACDHEEADTRMLLHAMDASQCGMRTVLLRTVDTDVVVLSIACFPELRLDQLWIAFGAGKYLRYLPIHEISHILGPERSTVLPLFHAFTGCDTVSFFSTKGKKSAYDTWADYPDLTDALLSLCKNPEALQQSNAFAAIERFVVLLYDRTSELVSVDACRKNLFARKGRSMESIPPTRDALIQHTKRACFQAVFVWNQCLKVSPPIPHASNWGWELSNGQWNPMWMTLPQASKACSELLKCGCKKGCTKNCKCVKALMKCTSLCNCGGECHDPIFEELDVVD